MDIKIYIILALVALSFYQYAAPEKSATMLEPVWGKASVFIDEKNPFNKKISITNATTNSCPEDYNPVCGNDGVTYSNSCKAALNDIVEVTLGEC